MQENHLHGSTQKLRKYQQKINLKITDFFFAQYYMFCKLMEHIVTSHIMNHADNNSILYPSNTDSVAKGHVKPSS